MVDVYYYVPEQKIDSILDCGMKLSEWHEREIYINGEARKCITALLNPRDDMSKFRSPAFRCLKIAVDTKVCYAGDRYLYASAQFSETAMELYKKSVKPIESYIFGTYRLPECLIISTILSEQISIADKRIDYPILYENSEKLYVNNILEIHRECNESFNDILLYYFYNKLAEFKKIDKIEDKDNKMAIFFDKESSRTLCVRMPDDDELKDMDLPNIIYSRMELL